MKRFRLSPEAATDVRYIWSCIAADSPRAAKKVRTQLFGACQRLAQNPGVGHTREDLADKPVSLWPVGSYLIVYDPLPRPLEIVRVLHGALDVQKVF